MTVVKIVKNSVPLMLPRRASTEKTDGHDALDREKVCKSILHFCLLYKNRTA